MDDDGQFDSVSWQRDPEAEQPQSPSHPHFVEERPLPSRSASHRNNGSTPSDPQAGENADAIDLAGIGDGSLECAVDTPMKENDGTKDAYVSYLVTTHV